MTNSSPRCPTIDYESAPSLSKVAAMGEGTPVISCLDDLDKICAALDCSVGDLLQAESLAASAAAPEHGRRAVGAEDSGSPSA